MQELEQVFNINNLSPKDRKLFDIFYLAHVGNVTMPINIFLKLDSEKQNLWSLAKRLLDAENLCIELNLNNKAVESNALAYKWGIISFDEFCNGLANALTEELEKTANNSDVRWKKI